MKRFNTIEHVPFIFLHYYLKKSEFYLLKDDYVENKNRMDQVAYEIPYLRGWTSITPIKLLMCERKGIRYHGFDPWRRFRFPIVSVDVAIQVQGHRIREHGHSSGASLAAHGDDGMGQVTSK